MPALNTEDVVCHVSATPARVTLSHPQVLLAEPKQSS